MVFAAGVLIGDWNWMSMRVIFLAFDLLLIGLLWFITKMISVDSDWIFLYAWNPLVLKEIVNSAHLDVSVGFTLALLLISLLYFEKQTRIAYLLIAAFLLSFAILLKIYPALLIPACCIFIFRTQGSLRLAGIFLTIIGIVVCLFYLPFMDVGWRRLSEGLLTFAEFWRMNEGAFSLLSFFTDYARVLSPIIVCLISIAVPLVRNANKITSLATDFFWVLLFWFLIIPTSFPWYAIPVCVLVLATGNRSLFPVGVVLSGALGAYYLSFYYEYHGYPAIWWTATRTIEHLGIWGILLWYLNPRKIVAGLT
jgi:hypothetical protein